MNVFRLFWVYIRVKGAFRWWSRSRLERYQKRQIVLQLRRLKKLSYYQDKLPDNPSFDNFLSLPIMDKSEFMDNFDDIISIPITKKDLLDFAINNYGKDNMDLFDGKYSVGLSSGTSGNKTLTVLGQEERRAYGVILLARNGVYGLFKRRVLFCLRTNNPAYMEISKYGFSIYFRDYIHGIDELIDLINEKKINVITGPPSLLMMIAKESDKIRSNIRNVVSYAETLSQIEKNQISILLNAPVSQIYQGAEGFLAHTCRKGSLHLNEDMNYFEFETVDETQSDVKNVIVTDLHRTTLPVIRYRMNDLLELDETTCVCGSSFRVIKQIHGRQDDVFYLRRGDGYAPLFPDYIRRSINQASPTIIEYQVIQKQIDLIEIRLVIEEDCKDIQSQIINNLSFYFDRLEVEHPRIVFTNDLPEVNPLSKKLIRVRREMAQPN